MNSKNKTVVKSMDLLQLFLTNSRLGLQEMVNLTGMPKTSVYRMAGSLEDMGFLTKEADGKYSLGLLFLQFGQLVAERLDIRNIALPVMRALRNEVSEAVNLIIPDGKEAIYIEKIDADRPVRVYTRVGRRAPLYAGACPRILLAHLPKHQREQYLQDVMLLPVASGTMTDRLKLEHELEVSRRNGFTVSHSELEDGSSAVAAPIFDYTGELVAGLSIAGPEPRFRNDDLLQLVESVKRRALEISYLLGYSQGRADGGVHRSHA